LSVEKYGNTDHLEFELNDHCWGRFSESGEYNAITLNDYCFEEGATKHRHTGSTMLSFDENGNGLQDLLIGDMDYPNLMLLTNGGSPDSAHIVAKDSLFPSYDVSVQLYSMPCPALTDVDGDGLQDLLVSPFDLTLTKSENKESVWFYKNTATAQYPHYELQTKSFLQNEMPDFGSGAYPVLHDMNGDGLLDLLVGNYGYYDSTVSNAYSITCHYSASVAYFRNTGTATRPAFLLITDNLADLRQKGYTSLIPTVGDLNGDGKPDILLGTAKNNLVYLENNSVSSDTLVLSASVTDYLSLQMPEYPAVQLFDLDKDGRLDLIVGTRRGNLLFYKNTGTLSAPSFSLQTDSLGGVNVRDFDYSYFGYATPCFFRTTTGETRLFVASEKGSIEYYKQIDGNLNGKFVMELSELFFIDNNKSFPVREGIRTAVTLGDVNNDGYPDIIAGNYAGGLSFYRGVEAPPRTISIANPIPVAFSLQLFPNPVDDCLHFTMASDMLIQSVIIYDMFGRRRFESTNPNYKTTETIDVSSLSAGVYIICFMSKSGVRQTAKFIKQ
ncbi:MAG: FG-GAP-like repeat-containing protein, partial [Bacteroidales bacterium]|nr:FG-GAP-like repeat-containing protein [Bacteroidales bacterium]